MSIAVARKCQVGISAYPPATLVKLARPGFVRRPSRTGVNLRSAYGRVGPSGSERARSARAFLPCRGVARRESAGTIARSMRNLTFGCAVLLLTSCVSGDLAPCSSGAVVLNRVGSTRGRAIEVLRSADRLESSHTGAAGAPSCSTAAYRNLLRRRDAAVLFRRVFDQGTPVGRVYALAGLYDVDRGAFDVLINAARSSSPPTFERIDGCVGTRVSRDEVFAELTAGTLSAWWRPYTE